MTQSVCLNRQQIRLLRTLRRHSYQKNRPARPAQEPVGVLFCRQDACIPRPAPTERAYRHTHLPAYFPYTQPKVLRRTLRQSVRLSSMVTVGKRGSTLSIVGQGLGEQLPSRFSSSTVGSHVGQRTSMSPSRASSISLPPPPGSREITPEDLRPGTDTVEETPRLSLSTSDGRTSELDHGEDGAERTDDEAENENESAESGPKTHLLPPVNFPSESFADSFNSVTSGVASSQSAVGGRSGPSPSISRTNEQCLTRRFSYMAELRARRDRSDTASMLTVDEITAEVENRRKSTAVSSLRSPKVQRKKPGRMLRLPRSRILTSIPPRILSPQLKRRTSLMRMKMTHWMMADTMSWTRVHWQRRMKTWSPSRLRVVR